MKLNHLVILFCFCSLHVMAQQDTTEKASITVASLYSSNISYYGQSVAEAMPYVLLNATVRFPVGIHFSAGSYKLLNYGSGISEMDLGVGYDYDIDSTFSAGASYSRSFFPSNSPLLQASNQNNINITTTALFRVLKSELSADYAFGTESDVFLSLTNSKEISLGSFLSKKNEFYIEPAIEVVAGTRHFYDTYTIEKGKGNSKGNGKGAGVQANAGNKTTTSTVESSSFNMLSYNFRLPLSLSRARYIAELSYQFSVLGAKADAELKKQQSLFGVAFYYQF